MNIYIPIEVKVRELEGRGLLALAAAERGHTVLLGAKQDTIELARRGQLPPGIVHMKSITPSDSMIELLGDLKKQGHLVTVQDEESGLLDETYERFAQLRFSKHTLPNVARVFAWGRFDAEALNSVYPDYSDKFVVTGSPRVDFWRKDFSQFYRSHPAMQQSESGRPLILIASNFSSLLNENRYWNIMARLRQAGYFDRDTEWEFREYENAAYQLRLIGKFVEMVRELTWEFPQARILVRPHPVESVDGWKKLIGDYPSVEVNRDGTISGWIRQASMVIHNGCTSALEAGVGEVPRIAYRPLPDSFEREIPNSVSSHAFTLEEVKEKVSRILNNQPLDDADDVGEQSTEILSSRFGNLSGPFAADKIVDEWEEMGQEAGLKGISASAMMQKKPDRSIPLKRRIKHHLIKARDYIMPPADIHDDNGQLLKSGHKFPDFKPEELSGLVENLQPVLNRFHQIEFERFGEKTFVISSKT